MWNSGKAGVKEWSRRRRRIPPRRRAYQQHEIPTVSRVISIFSLGADRFRFIFHVPSPY